MHFNQIYSISNERVHRRVSCHNIYDIELQHPQPRCRPTFSNDQDNDPYNNQHGPLSQSTAAKPEEPFSSKLQELSPTNNTLEIPRNISIASSTDPMLISSLPVVVEEK